MFLPEPQYLPLIIGVYSFGFCNYVSSHASTLQILKKLVSQPAPSHGQVPNTLEGHSVGESTVVHEVQAGILMGRRNIYSAPVSMKPQCTPSYIFHDTGGRDTRSAFFDWALLIMDLLKLGVDRHTKKVAELLHYQNSNIKVIREKLRSMTSSSELVRESVR